MNSRSGLHPGQRRRAGGLPVRYHRVQCKEINDGKCWNRRRESTRSERHNHDDRFYQSNVNAWAIDPRYQTRKVLYNLYHVLNHDNLFGGGYAGQARRMVDGLAAEIS
ncbi:MAG: fructosamine kinase family protein [Halioglobus sp.]|nr:fructosamine kinase family protein [Halioglobus sp.]